MDLDAFFCACEELNDPSLRGTTFAVGGSADRRGVIASCSYAARAVGVHSAMPTSQALRLCPTLKLIQGRHADYSAISKKVMKILTDTSPFMEQVSIDEAFLDISCLREGSYETAVAIQNEVRDTLGLPCSLGAASNKLVAKMANTIGKKSIRTTTYPQSNTSPMGRRPPSWRRLPSESSGASARRPRSGSADSASRPSGSSPNIRSSRW